MRHLATIQKIAEVRPIEGADAIEAVRIKEWWCVAKKDEFKVDDYCVYFEIDSLLPVTNPNFEFLAKGNKPKTMNIDGKTYVGYRLKTIKLRGQISQGLALPLPALFADANMDSSLYEVDNDVSESLDVVKWEAPIPAQLSGKIRGSFPGFLPKTDEERVQNLAEVVARQQGVTFYVTEKLDGSSATFYRHTTIADGERFGVCSRNLDLLDTPGNTFWELAKKYELDTKLPEGFCVQGEAVGEGIQDNKLKIKGHDLYVYNVYDIKNAKYLDYIDFVAFCEKLGLKTVPVLDTAWLLTGTVEDLLKMAEGKSVIAPEVEREGLVFRPMQEKQEVIAGVMGRLSFKAISNIFLLGEK